MSSCIKEPVNIIKFRRSKRLNAQQNNKTVEDKQNNIQKDNLEKIKQINKDNQDEIDKQMIENDKQNKKLNPCSNNKLHSHYKYSRKRCQPVPGNKCHKRRRMDYTRRFIPPTKFLLGGNIHDPLNLNSLQDEEINRAMNAITPKSSPLPTPQHKKGEIEVIIPPNICDPLNLAQCDDENTAEYEAHLISPLKKIKRTKKKRKKSGCISDMPGEEAQCNEIPSTTTISTSEETNIISKAEETSTSSVENKPEGIYSDNITSISIQLTSEALPPVPILEPAIPDEEAQTSIPPIEEIATTSATILAPSPPIVSQPPQISTITPTPALKKLSKKDSNCHLDLKLQIKQQRGLDVKDKIVSPVVPQPTHGITHSRYRQLTPEINKGLKTPNFREKNCKFQYGNYNKYYGYRNFNQEVDPRIKILEKYRHKLSRKDILDIGCNIGHITLTLARDFNAKSVVGLDIDKHLIKVARTNIKHYVNCSNSPQDEHEINDFSKPMYASFSGNPSPRSEIDKKLEMEQKKNLTEAHENPDVFFPISMPIVYGGISTPGIPSKLSNHFPHNVSFVQGNYVLDSDILLNVEQAQFDVILCLSVTKWFHLNWGDAGLKRVFKRMYAQLRLGGVLILEPQSWGSYKKKKKLTESIWRNYQSIEFFPHHFTEYLLSEVGFTKCETLGYPVHSSKGFQRPIKMFTKGLCKTNKDGNPPGEWT